MAQWLGRWICILEVPGSNPLPLLLGGRFVNTQLVSLPPVGIFNKFLFNL